MPPRSQNTTTETYPRGFGLMPGPNPRYRRQMPRNRVPVGRARITRSNPTRNTSGQESENGLRPIRTSSRQSRRSRINGGEEQSILLKVYRMPGLFDSLLTEFSRCRLSTKARLPPICSSSKTLESITVSSQDSWSRLHRQQPCGGCDSF
jgi:hypothetical protein